jgi:hypothetical protein
VLRQSRLHAGIAVLRLGIVALALNFFSLNGRLF